MAKTKVIHKSLPRTRHTLCGLNKNRVKHSIFVFKVTCKSCRKKLKSRGFG